MNYTPQDQKNWQKAQEILQKEIPQLIYSSWFKTLKLYAISGDTMVLEAPNQFARDAIHKRYMSTLTQVVRMAFNRVYDIIVDIGEDISRQMEQLSKTLINPRYTFDNFIVGSSNTFAYAAAVAVADNPGEMYNPLFLYGGVGLGKTHLMNAIGNYISSHDPHCNVLFISSETFTNEFIEALTKKKNADLRERMRNVDVFMIDDVQFLSKTVATQEEFFHTFNELRAKGKQIIISSDRPPKELPAIEERLRSRFEWGLTVDIRRPDFETRVAILHKKCEDEEIDVGDDVLEYIAERVKNNIRELEGALNRLRAQSEMMNEDLDIEFARETLKDILPSDDKKTATPQTVLQTVAEKYQVTVDDIISPKRSREIAMARQVAMYILREVAHLSTTAIGKELGDRDHTTVMHGCDKVAQMMNSDASFKQGMAELMSDLKK